MLEVRTMASEPAPKPTDSGLVKVQLCLGCKHWYPFQSQWEYCPECSEQLEVFERA